MLLTESAVHRLCFDPTCPDLVDGRHRDCFRSYDARALSLLSAESAWLEDCTAGRSGLFNPLAQPTTEVKSNTADTAAIATRSLVIVTGRTPRSDRSSVCDSTFAGYRQATSTAHMFDIASLCPMRLLVTGGAGYIGSVCTARLIEIGHEVTVMDDLSTGHRDAVHPDATFVQARIHDADRHLDASYDAVLHFAAKSLVGESVENPEMYWENNILGSLALINAVRAAGIPRMIFSSTAATYGEPEMSPIDETCPTMPVNPYGMSKLAVDNMLTAEARAHGLAAVSLRYFNVGGAYANFGERHAVETHLVPNLLKVASGERVDAAIFGNDYPTRDGTCVRDYLHVVDLCDAHHLALTAAQPGVHRVINLGTGTGYTVSEVLDAVRRTTAHDVPVRQESRRPGDPATLVASNVRARDELGWAPTRGLDDIVGDAWVFAQQVASESNLGQRRL